jgi:hypothetical protein
MRAKSLCFGNLPPPSLETQAPAMSRCEEDSCRQRKGSIKPLKHGFKVGQNQLRKKWIVQKKDRQLRDVIESALLLEALGMPL